MAAPLVHSVSVCVSSRETPSDEGTDCFPEDGKHPPVWVKSTAL